MAYLTIDRNRLGFLLRFGIDSDELKRFFIDNRSQLILKGAKVQNLPRDPADGISTILILPPNADHVLQKWFSAKITMINPVSVDELLETFHLYEDLGEPLPESDKKRLSRSCLVHLFSADPSPKLIEFLKSPISGDNHEKDRESATDKEFGSQQPGLATEQTLLNPEFASAIVTLLEGKNPEEQLANLPPMIASFLHGLYAVKEGCSEEVRISLEGLGELEQVKSILSEYEDRLVKTKESSRPTATGIQILRFDEVDNPEFDFDRDQVLGKCTRDYPETAVFIQPFAIRTWDGKLLSLERQETREALFPNSGDIQAFSGKNYSKQPVRDELGIWHIAPNDTYSTSTHRNNFHLKNSKTEIYEVHLVPFAGSDYDSVRGFIKQHIISRSGKKQLEHPLFMLSDGPILGCPNGKDLTRDDAFDEGLPCWHSLKAFRFEGRMLVPGPLPAHEKYECATLASTLKKFFSSKKTEAEKLTKAQQKYLLDNLEAANLNASRKARLLEDLKYIESDESTIGLLIEEAMKSEKIAERIEQLIKEEVDDQTEKNGTLKRELELLEKQRNVLKENIAKQEKEQKALPSSVSKAIKDSIKNAKEDVFGTLGQVVVFKALMDEWSNASNSLQTIANDSLPTRFRILDHDKTPFVDFLKSLGLSARYARALEVTGEAISSVGMILVIEGITARIVAEAWGRKDKSGCMVMDCAIGLTDDVFMNDVAIMETRPIVILDANLSPADVYAKSLIDRLQRRIISPENVRFPSIVMSLTDGVASLPLPSNIESIAIRISLDQGPEFLREDEVEARLEDAETEEGGEIWTAHLWKPALNGLLKCLKDMPTEDAALVLSVLNSMSREQGANKY